MAVISKNNGQEKLSLWDVLDPSRVTHLKSQYFNLGIENWFDMSMKMDEQFIVVPIFHNEATTFSFFSKKTLDLHWQKTVDGDTTNNFAYDQGILPIPVSEENDGLIHIEMYDVNSRTCFRQMRTTVKRERYYWCLVGFNSKFMVVVHG